MSILKWPFVVSVAVCFLGGAQISFAGESAGGSVGLGNASPSTTKEVSWEEFLARCQHPEQFFEQHAPDRITIQCTDVVRDYVELAPGGVPLAVSRNVAAKIDSDKFRVATLNAAVATVPRAGSCLRYKEVEKVVTVERPATCAEVMGIKGSVQDFCVATLDASKSVNPKLVNVADTGRMVDSCAGITAGTSGPKSIYP